MTIITTFYFIIGLISFFWVNWRISWQQDLIQICFLIFSFSLLHFPTYLTLLRYSMTCRWHVAVCIWYNFGSISPGPTKNAWLETKRGKDNPFKRDRWHDYKFVLNMYINSQKHCIVSSTFLHMKLKFLYWNCKPPKIWIKLSLFPLLPSRHFQPVVRSQVQSGRN